MRTIKPVFRIRICNFLGLDPDPLLFLKIRIRIQFWILTFFREEVELTEINAFKMKLQDNIS